MSVARTVRVAEPETLGTALERAALDPQAGLRFLNRREEAVWVPWSEILVRSREVAAGLASLGVEAGDRLGLIFPTCRELVEALFGAVLARAIPACLPPPPRFGKLDPFARRTDAMLESADTRLTLVDTRVKRRIGESVRSRGLGTRTLTDLRAGKNPQLESAQPAAPAMIQFSSGTTLAPKPVALSHASVLEQARLLNSLWTDTDEVRHSGLSWLPLHHDMGLIGCLFVALERSGELTMMPPEVFAARPAIWLRSISTFGATVSPATNFAYSYCTEEVRDLELDGVDLSNWSVALNGAEPISARVMRRFGERFGRWGFRATALTPVYGLAEASLAVTFSRVAKPFSSRRFARDGLGPGDRVREDPNGRELVSVGRPVDGFELSIRDDELAQLEEGTVGRIWTRGPTLMEGYVGQEAATREVLRDGWLDTGDLGFVYRAELYVCGRVKDQIIVRGKNHSPVEIEQGAESVPAARAGGTVAVSYMPDGGDRELILVLVERSRGASAAQVGRLPEDCRQAVLAETGLEIDEIVLLSPDTIPRTSSGKVRRSAALRLYLNGRLGPS